MNVVLTETAKHWRSILLSATGIAVAGAVLAFILPPIYRATTLLVPTINESRTATGVSMGADAVGALASRFGLGGLRGSTDGGPEVLATLTARAFLEKFITEEDLMPVLFADKWDAAAKQWRKDLDADEIPTMADAYRKYTNDVLEVRSDFQTGLVTLRIDWKDPTLAAKWANQLVARINALMRDEAIVEAKASLEYLTAEIGRSPRVEVQNSLFVLIEQSLTQISVAQARPEYAFRVIDPATPPMIDDYVKPKRVLIILVSFLLGGFFAAIFVMMRVILRHRSPREDEAQS